MKVYISGPITGTNDYLERFEKAEQYLRQQGCEVINPAKITEPLPESTTWEEYMKTAIVLLEQCEMVFMLRNWQKSKGAVIEQEHASNLGIHTIYEKEAMYEQNKESNRLYTQRTKTD